MLAQRTENLSNVQFINDSVCYIARRRTRCRSRIFLKSSLPVRHRGSWMNFMDNSNMSMDSCEISKRLGYRTSSEPFNFGADLDCSSDLGFFLNGISPTLAVVCCLLGASRFLTCWRAGLVDHEVLEYMLRCREQGRPLPRYRPRNRSPSRSRTASTRNSSAARGEFCICCCSLAVSPKSISPCNYSLMPFDPSLSVIAHRTTARLVSTGSWTLSNRSRCCDTALMRLLCQLDRQCTISTLIWSRCLDWRSSFHCLDIGGLGMG